MRPICEMQYECIAVIGNLHSRWDKIVCDCTFKVGRSLSRVGVESPNQVDGYVGNILATPTLIYPHCLKNSIARIPNIALPAQSDPSSLPTHNLHRTGQNLTYAFSQEHVLQLKLHGY